MAQNTPVPVFPETFKTVAATSSSWASNSAFQIGLEAILPSDFYACTGLFMGLSFVNDLSFSGRNLKTIAVQSDQTTTPAVQHSLSVNIAPDSNNRIALSMDLSALINPSGRNVIMLTFDNLVRGNLEFFKLDMRYQIVGIR